MYFGRGLQVSWPWKVGGQAGNPTFTSFKGLRGNLIVIAAKADKKLNSKTIRPVHLASAGGVGSGVRH